MSTRSLALALVTAATLPAQASIPISAPGQTYSQSFDGLASTGASVTWTNDSTLAGWSLIIQTGAAVSNYYGGDGSSNTGAFYSFGGSGAGDRALGGLASGGAYFGSPASGAVAGWIGVQLSNNSGHALNGFSLGFDGEQWRNGGNTSAQAMVMQYGFGTTMATVASWATPGGSFNWSSPVVGATAAAVDGNAVGKVGGLGGSIATTWNAGDSLWVRCIENNDVGNDHGLAIDNFSFTAGDALAPVPLPPAVALFAAGIGMLAWTARQRRRV